MKRVLTGLAASVIVLALSAPLVAQSSVTYDPNAEKFVILSLNQSYISLGEAAKNFLRTKEQVDEGLMSQQSYDDALARYRNAKLNYDMALMRVLFNASNILVERAVKHVKEDGTKIVTVTVRNEPGGSFEVSKIKRFGGRETSLTGGDFGSDSSAGNGDDPQETAQSLLAEDARSYDEILSATLPFVEGQGLAIEDVINLTEINNIFINLSARTETNEMVMISKPYEKKIPILRANERAQVQFELLRDVENCDIGISFGDKTMTKSVFLELESATAAGGVRLECPITSLQADLDSTATFNIDLERFSNDTAFALRVVDLPSQIDVKFLDADNNNQQITTVNFTQGKVTKRIQLELTMPVRDSESVQVEKAIPFKAVIFNTKQLDEARELERQYARDIPEAELTKLGASIINLTIIPRGVGEIETSASNLYYPIQPDEVASMTLTVKNRGTGELKNIKVEADLPNNEWNFTIEPDLIRELLPQQEEKVKLVFTPPENATVGDHIIKVKVEAKDRNRVIEADDKEVTISIKEKPDIWGRLILIVLLIGIVLGIVIFGIKLSRR